MEQKNIVNVLLCFFRTFAPIFTSNSLVFVDRGTQEYFLPQDAGYPVAKPLASSSFDFANTTTNLVNIQGGHKVTYQC